MPLSFEQAIAQTQQLLSQSVSPEQLQQTITELVQTDNGARGFFVTFLTGDFALADRPELLCALQSAPTRVADLLTKNLAMATAMELTHFRDGNPEQAAGSAKVQQHTRSLIQALQANLPELQTCLQQLALSLTSPSGEYHAFLERWGYDLEQRAAIQTALETVIA
jgi:hypothetical protein